MLPVINLRSGEAYPNVLALYRAYGQWRAIRAIPDPALRARMAWLLVEYLLVCDRYWEYHRSERMRRYLRRLTARVQTEIQEGLSDE
jgi:hypothetical protein